MPRISQRERGEKSTALHMIRRRYGRVGREVEGKLDAKELDLERDADYLMSLGLYPKEGRLRVDSYGVGRARFLPELRIVDPSTRELLVELVWSGPDSVQVVDRRSGKDVVLAMGTVETVEDIRLLPCFVVIDRDSHPEDTSAEVLCKTEWLQTTLSEHGLADPRKKPARYDVDPRRFLILEAAEALERRDGRPPTDEQIARELSLPASTARRWRKEAGVRFGVKPRTRSRDEELRRLLEEQRADDRATHRQGVLEYDEVKAARRGHVSLPNGESEEE